MQSAHTFTQFPKDEQEDFVDICKDAGIPHGEFEVTDVEEVSADPGPIKRTVTVSRKGKARSYEGGHATKWIDDFERDAKNGEFK
jgi:hypothetical protein